MIATASLLPGSSARTGFVLGRLVPDLPALRCRARLAGGGGERQRRARLSTDVINPLICEDEATRLASLEESLG